MDMKYLPVRAPGPEAGAVDRRPRCIGMSRCVDDEPGGEDCYVTAQADP